MAAFDGTYLQQVLSQSPLDQEGEVYIVGGAWNPDDPQNARFPIVAEDGTCRDSKKVKKATDMLAG